MWSAFAYFEVSLGAGFVLGGYFVLAMPTVGCFAQEGSIFTDSPRGSLVETDGQVDIQVGVIGFVETGQVVVAHGIVDGAVGYLRHEVLDGDAIVVYPVDEDTATQFAVEVDESGEVFAGLGIDFLADEFGNILHGGELLARVALNQDLVGDDVFATEADAILVLLGDGERVGDEVAFAPEELVYEVVHVLGSLDLEFKSERLSKMLGQFVLETHGFATAS